MPLARQVAAVGDGEYPSGIKSAHQTDAVEFDRSRAKTSPVFSRHGAASINGEPPPRSGGPTFTQPSPVSVLVAVSSLPANENTSSVTGVELGPSLPTQSGPL